LALSRLIALSRLSQYRVRPIVYYETRNGVSFIPPGREVHGYVLCYNRECIGLHYYPDTRDVIFDGPDDTVLRVLDAWLTGKVKPRTMHEALALRAIGIQAEPVFEAPRNSETLVIRGDIYVLDWNNCTIIIYPSRMTVPSPGAISRIASFISRCFGADFLVDSGKWVLACSESRGHCVKLPLARILDLLARKIPVKKPEAVERRVPGRVRILVDGKWYSASRPGRPPYWEARDLRDALEEAQASEMAVSQA